MKIPSSFCFFLLILVTFFNIRGSNTSALPNQEQNEAQSDESSIAKFESRKILLQVFSRHTQSKEKELNLLLPEVYEKTLENVNNFMNAVGSENENLKNGLIYMQMFLRSSHYNSKTYEKLRKTYAIFLTSLLESPKTFYSDQRFQNSLVVMLYMVEPEIQKGQETMQMYLALKSFLLSIATANVSKQKSDLFNELAQLFEYLTETNEGTLPYFRRIFKIYRELIMELFSNESAMYSSSSRILTLCEKLNVSLVTKRQSELFDLYLLSWVYQMQVALSNTQHLRSNPQDYAEMKKIYETLLKKIPEYSKQAI